MRGIPAVTALAVLACATAAGATSPAPHQTASVATGAGPCGITAPRDGALWVGVYGAGRVLSIDPRRGRVQATVKDLRWACRVVVGPAAIWVTRDQAGQVVRISRGNGERTGYAVGASPLDVLLAKGSVWVTSYVVGTILQIDAARRRPLRIFKNGVHAAGLALCAGRIWVGHGRDATWLSRIDPDSHRITAVDLHTQSPAWPRCVRGELWVTTSDAVLRVDPESGAVLAHVRIGGTPVEAIAGPDGLVWVTDKERSLVFRIDPATNTVVDSFRAGPGAYAMARIGDSIWITSFAGSDVRRFDG